MLAICAELPDHIDRGHTAATHTLLVASIQDRASCASVTTASTLSALCSIGCFAWPCQPLVGRAAGTEVRSRTRGARVFKGAGAVGRRVLALVGMRPPLKRLWLWLLESYWPLAAFRTYLVASARRPPHDGYPSGADGASQRPARSLCQALQICKCFVGQMIICSWSYSARSSCFRSSSSS